DVFCKIISFISSYIGFLFCLILIFIFFNKIFALYFGATYGIAVAFNFLLKHLINRPRPYVVDPAIINKFPAAGQAFPSGHTLSAGIIAAFLIFVILKTVKNKKLKVFLICLCNVFVLFVIFARIYLGQHYLSDTMAGLAFAGIYSAVGLYIYNKGSKNGNKSNFKQVEEKAKTNKRRN
ncbi:MAG: phosphatase PAP2 family protein, partial [Clostridia bacterium]|nr:phosphatase PAP2 family protein [Clostridia bacterium]